MDAFNNVYIFIPQISQPYKRIGSTIESNNFSLHSTEKLLSLDFDRRKYIALVAFCFSNFLVILNLVSLVKVMPRYL